MSVFQYKADPRLNGKIKIDGVNTQSFVTWQISIADELNPSTVNKKNIKILDTLGTPQDITVSYDKNNKTIIVTQNFKCVYDTNYTLLIGNVRCNEGRSFHRPLSINYIFTDNGIASEDFQELSPEIIQRVIGVSDQQAKKTEGYANGLPKPVDKLSMTLSIIAIAALILGLFPIEAVSDAGMIIWVMLSLSLIAVPIFILILCGKKKDTHNIKIPKIISIVVLASFALMNILAAAGINLYFSFIPPIRL